MKRRYYFSDRINQRIMEYLDGQKIRYKISGENSDLPLVSFNLYSSDADMEGHLKALEKMNVRKPIVYAEYSTFEVENAKMLWMTPKKQCIDITNNHEAYHCSCRWITSTGVQKAMHKEQQGLFVIAREPSMKTSTAFWTETTGFAEIFTDIRIYELVCESMLKGIEFKKVFVKKGGYSKILFQMSSPNILGRESIVLGHGEKIEVCPLCGKEQYFIDNAYQLHLDCSKIKEESDLYVTERIFGQGIAYPLYIVSQRFYQMLKKNKLVTGVIFSPVSDVSATRP